MKPVLLNKAHIALKDFVSKDTSRPQLTRLHVHPDYCQATDSKIAIQAPYDDVDSEEFPATSVQGSGIPDKGILVDVHIVEKAFKHVDTKSPLPVLHHIYVDTEGGKPVLSVTDLQHEASFRHTDNTVEYTSVTVFESLARMLTEAQEKTPTTTITLQAKDLKRLATWADKYGNGRMQFHIDTAEAPVLCVMPLPEQTQPACALIMPYKDKK